MIPAHRRSRSARRPSSAALRTRRLPDARARDTGCCPDQWPATASAAERTRSSTAQRPPVAGPSRAVISRRPAWACGSSRYLAATLAAIVTGTTPPSRQRLPAAALRARRSVPQTGAGARLGCCPAQRPTSNLLLRSAHAVPQARGRGVLPALQPDPALLPCRARRGAPCCCTRSARAVSPPQQALPLQLAPPVTSAALPPPPPPGQRRRRRPPPPTLVLRWQLVVHPRPGVLAGAPGEARLPRCVRDRTNCAMEASLTHGVFGLADRSLPPRQRVALLRKRKKTWR